MSHGARYERPWGETHRMDRTFQQHGAALLMAMLTVALVATLAAGALWQQWRSVEVEASERSRVQASWILGGALDWARLILREDARSGGADHLAEPWAVVLAESRLSAFLAADRNNTDTGDDAFLSGQITDAQSRLNVMNLVVGGKVSEPDLQAFTRLFELLGLEESELELLAENLRLALEPETQNTADTVALLPQRVEQLRWLGLTATSLQRLSAFVTVLPTRTPVNLNTASREVLAASIPGADMAAATQLIAARERRPFQSLAAANRVLVPAIEPLDSGRFSVATRYFEVRGRLRLDNTVVEERSLVLRNGLEVTTLWRERAALAPQTAAQTAQLPR